MKVGIYARLSQDRDGTQTATARQVEDCRSLAAARGWEVTTTYEDVDLSAYNGVQRPAYDRLVADLRAGTVQGVIVWKLDRLLRRPRDLEAFLDLLQASGAVLASVNDTIDTSNATGQFVVRTFVNLANLESDTIALREHRKHREIAAAGRPTKGGTRPFGLTREWDALVPQEAQHVRDAVRRILAGESVRGIASDWAGRGIVTPTGGRWQPTPLRRLLVSPRIAGARELDGELIVSGAIPAIIDLATFRRLRAILTDPARRTSGVNARRYLLTGFLRCGQCGKRLAARPRADHVRRYICLTQPMGTGCGRMFVISEPLEDLVREMVIAAVDGPELAEALKRREEALGDDFVTELRDTEAALAELSIDYYSARRITRGEYLAARAPLEQRAEAARRRIAADSGTTVLRDVAGTLRAAWDAHGLDWRRAVIGAVIDTITIGPGRRGYNRFDPDRVDVTWRA